MIHTSIGFHTFTIFIRINGKEVKELFKDFFNYRDTTNEIKIYVPKGKKNWTPIIDNDFKTKGKKPKVWRIDYIDDNKKGITWFLRFNNNSRNYKEYIVEARINPKILAGIKDYITAANGSYLKIVEERFNEEVNKISKILGRFSWYKLKRIDFCINFDLKEMGYKCTPEEMIKLIKQADYSSRYTEWMKYDKKSHRTKSGKYSLYLKSGSLNINCYYKYKQMDEDDFDYEDREKALNIIRFEVQCKYRKVYTMSQIMKQNFEHGSLDLMHQILSDLTSKNIIDQYFNRIIGSGDYYTLKRAIEIIEDQGFSCEKEDRLIETLKEINEHRGIANTRRELISHNAVSIFNRSLKELNALGINPVTAPTRFGTKPIPNLLRRFYQLQEAGRISDNSYIDPYEPLEEPYELSTDQTDVADQLDNGDFTN